MSLSYSAKIYLQAGGEVQASLLCQGGKGAARRLLYVPIVVQNSRQQALHSESDIRVCVSPQGVLEAGCRVHLVIW